MIGRVVNALGQPIDGKGPIEAEGYRPIEFKAPGVHERQPVEEPMQQQAFFQLTQWCQLDVVSVNLSLATRQTGKTAIAIDAILNQKGQDMICVYVAIGQKASTVATVVETLERHGAMDYTIVVAATAADPAPMQYLGSVCLVQQLVNTSCTRVKTESQQARTIQDVTSWRFMMT